MKILKLLVEDEEAVDAGQDLVFPTLGIMSPSSVLWGVRCGGRAPFPFLVLHACQLSELTFRLFYRDLAAA
jgi:hypothetical protein